VQDGAEMHWRKLHHGGHGKEPVVDRQHVLRETGGKPCRVYELQEDGDHYLPAMLQEDSWDGGHFREGDT
jgi:hypothetical protein